MIKNTAKIKDLLHKYFEGETSLEEEQVLKTYFNGQDVSSELQVYQGLFQFFTIEKDVSLPQKRHTSPPTPLYKNVSKPTKTANIRHLYVQIAKIAAIALLAIAAYWFVLPHTQTEQQQTAHINWNQYELTDEEEAMEKTIAALRLVSAKLNGGANRAAKEVHHVKAAAKIFKE